MAKYRDFDDDIDFDSPRVKKGGPKNKNWIFILALVIEVIIIVGLSVVLYFVKKIDNIKEIQVKEEEIITNPDIKEEVVEKLKGYTNILLLGTDIREDEEGSGMTAEKEKNRTDAILVASINNDTKEVRIISIYRDTLVEMGEFDNATGSIKDTRMNKITETAWDYGVEACVTTVNRNLDLDIKDIIMVNWSALIDIVDAVGGVDIPITQMEQRWLNRYLVDTSKGTGREYTEVTTYEDDPNLSDGALQADAEKRNTKIMTHLTGIQATAYARVRYGDGLSDYGRTQRQRNVISQIVTKAKKMSNITATVNALLKNVYMTGNLKDYIMEHLTQFLSYNLTTIDGGFPFVRNDLISHKEDWIYWDPVIPVTLESNVKELHKILFDELNYEPSNTVKNISEKIKIETGVSE